MSYIDEEIEEEKQEKNHRLCEVCNDKKNKSPIGECIRQPPTLLA